MLSEITEWLKALVIAVFKALWDFVADIFVYVFGLLVDGIVALLANIPVPDWLAGGLNAIWVRLDPAVIFIVTACGVPTALSIIAGGLAFRLLRKIFTLAQW